MTINPSLKPLSLINTLKDVHLGSLLTKKAHDALLYLVVKVQNIIIFFLSLNIYTYLTKNIRSQGKKRNSLVCTKVFNGERSLCSLHLGVCFKQSPSAIFFTHTQKQVSETGRIGNILRGIFTGRVFIQHTRLMKYML